MVVEHPNTVKAGDVLLPAARVDVFAFAEETRDLFESLKGDWRFARVDLDVKMNNIDQAIEKYKEYASPDVVVIGTDDIGEGFIEKLSSLAAQCEAGTEAVVIGPKNDVQLYRRLVGMGVRDYLVRPVQADDMVDVLAKSLFEKMGISESRLVAVIGAKGGVGTTTICQAMAWQAAEKLKQKTILMDAAGGWSSLNVALGAEPTAGLAECVRNAVEGSDEDLERMYVKVSDNLTLFACGGDDLLHYAVDGDMYERAVNRVMKTFPVVFIDLSCAPADVRYRIIDRAHEVIVVTTPALTSLRHARTLLSEIKVRRGEHKDIVDLVLNKKGLFGGREMNDKDMVTALDHSPQAIVEWLPDIFNESEASGRPVATLKKGADVENKLEALCMKATAYKGDAALKQDGKDGGFLGKIFSNLKK